MPRITATVAVEVVVDMATVVAVVKTADNNNNFELLVSWLQAAAVQTSRIWGDDASELDRLFVGTPHFCSIQNLYGRAPIREREVEFYSAPGNPPTYSIGWNIARR
jgi:hypothetical protein